MVKDNQELKEQVEKVFAMNPKQRLRSILISATEE